jgi:hypothetical protein
VIEAIAEKAMRAGRLRPRKRRRLMSYPLVIRLVIAMTLLPGPSYAEAMRVLAGLLADIPFTLAWHVPTAKTVTECTYRAPFTRTVRNCTNVRSAGRRMFIKLFAPGGCTAVPAAWPGGQPVALHIMHRRARR